MGLLDGNKENCIKTSSKCIMWFGGKVCAITVCDDDTVETVIKKIGKVLHGLEKSLDINDLDFSNLLAEKECPPEDLKGLIQLILNKISETNPELTGTVQTITVTPASCFTVALGSDPIPIETYVEYLGETVCSQNQEIENLKESLAQLRQSVQDLTFQVETLIGG